MVTIRNRNGKSGEALDSSQPVIYQVAYYNPAPKVQDIIITAQVGDTAEVTDPYDGEIYGRRSTGQFQVYSHIAREVFLLQEQSWINQR